MRFLNPKTDFAFKKIFGSDTSQDILISFLNAILDLTGPDVIVEVRILDPYLAPKIEGLKDTFLDVRVKDQRGRSYIVEMQVLNLEGFEKRVLYNTCKTYVNQLGKGDDYRALADVVAVTVTDFVMFPDLAQVISRFRLRAEENPAIYHQDIELVFAELPKFAKTEAELATPLDRWLTFFKTAKDFSAIPQSLAVEPAIVHAFEKANRAAWSEDELDAQEKREFWIQDIRYATERARKAAAEALAQGLSQGIEQGLSQGIAQGRNEGIEQGRNEGLTKGLAIALEKFLLRRFGPVPSALEARIAAASADQIELWIENALSAPTLDELFR